MTNDITRIPLISKQAKKSIAIKRTYSRRTYVMKTSLGNLDGLSTKTALTMQSLSQLN